MTGHHITKTRPLTPATDRVTEYVAAMLDSLVIDSLNDRAMLADLMLLARRMRKNLQDVKKELIAVGLGGAGDEGEWASWVYFHGRVVEVLEGESFGVGRCLVWNGC